MEVIKFVLPKENALKNLFENIEILKYKNINLSSEIYYESEFTPNVSSWEQYGEREFSILVNQDKEYIIMSDLHVLFVMENYIRNNIHSANDFIKDKNSMGFLFVYDGGLNCYFGTKNDSIMKQIKSNLDIYYSGYTNFYNFIALFEHMFI